MEKEKVESVYCDFSKLPTDSGKSIRRNISFVSCVKKKTNRRITQTPNCFVGFETRIGDVKEIGIPKSCADLRNNGHKANGLYLVMGTDKVETVHCDFSALPSNSSKSNFTSMSKKLNLIKSNK